MSTYKDIQHILVTTHIYIFEKNTHSRAQGIVSKFTPIHILNILLITNYLHIFEILKYAYVEGHILLLIHTLQCILCHIFTYIHTIERYFPCYLYSHTYIHTIERYFPCYLDAKYPSWGSQILVKTLSSMS